MIGRSNNEAIRIILFDHLQEAIQHTGSFSNIVTKATGRTNTVKFIKEVYTPRVWLSDSNTRRSFAAVSPMNFVIKPSSLTTNSGKPSSPASTAAVSVLPVPGLPDRRSFRRGGEASAADDLDAAVFADNPFELFLGGRCEHHVFQAHVRIGDRKDLGGFATRTGNGDRTPAQAVVAGL